MWLTLAVLILKLQDYQDDNSCADKDSSSPNGNLTSKDFNSPIWQKTPIAAVAEIKEKSKENEPLAETKEEVEIRIV